MSAKLAWAFWIRVHTARGLWRSLKIALLVDLTTSGGVRALRSIAEETLALVLRLGGAMSSEHGDGLARSEWLQRTYGEEVCAAMQALKHAADPYGLFNPRKMLDSPPMDTHLRYGAAYSTRSWVPAMDFTRSGGLAAAIEQIGRASCRERV